MADGTSNAYSRRLRSRRRSDSTSSEEDEELESITRSGGRRYGVYTPEPVQRTLVLRSGDDLEEEEDEEDSDFEELDNYGGTVYRSTMYSPPQVDEEDVAEPEDAQEEEDEDIETPGPEVRRSELKRRAAGAAAYFKRPKDAEGLWQKVTDSKTVKTVLKYLRRLWRFVLRNSFMAVNVLWLLAPLCCFVIAITVPQYLTTAIQYVDVFSTKVIGARGNADSGLDQGAMRSVVQEIVDLKLLGMNEEIGLLRQTVQSQEREIEALKLLHDSLGHAHDEAQHKFSFAEPDNAITVHVEKVVAKHTEELVRLEMVCIDDLLVVSIVVLTFVGHAVLSKQWEKFMDYTSRLQQDLRTATKQQSMLSSVVKEQEEKMDVSSIVAFPPMIQAYSLIFYGCGIIFRVVCARYGEEDCSSPDARCSR